jgi:hypothetical protein
LRISNDLEKFCPQKAKPHQDTYIRIRRGVEPGIGTEQDDPRRLEFLDDAVTKVAMVKTLADNLPIKAEYHRKKKYSGNPPTKGQFRYLDQIDNFLEFLR